MKKKYAIQNKMYTNKKCINKPLILELAGKNYNQLSTTQCYFIETNMLHTIHIHFAGI